jgi:hypothetical protein
MCPEKAEMKAPEPNEEAKNPLSILHISGLICVCTLTLLIACSVLLCEIYFKPKAKQNKNGEQTRQSNAALLEALKLLEQFASVVKYSEDRRSYSMAINLDEKTQIDAFITKLQ